MIEAPAWGTIVNTSWFCHPHSYIYIPMHFKNVLHLCSMRWLGWAWQVSQKVSFPRQHLHLTSILLSINGDLQKKPLGIIQEKGNVLQKWVPGWGLFSHNPLFPNQIGFSFFFHSEAVQNITQPNFNACHSVHWVRIKLIMQCMHFLEGE